MMYQQQLALIKRTGDYNFGQMEILINAIKTEPSGMRHKVVVAIIHDKILKGKDFQSIIDWLSIR